MELFRINGLSSEDIMRPGQNPTKAFLGTMFKMGAPEPEAVEAAELAAPLGMTTEDHEPSPGDEHRWTEKALKAMPKEKLIELGGSLGVADLSGTKDKLVDAILAVQ